jgi:hypothetical protein
VSTFFLLLPACIAMGIGVVILLAGFQGLLRSSTGRSATRPRRPAPSRKSPPRRRQDMAPKKRTPRLGEDVSDVPALSALFRGELDQFPWDHGTRVLGANDASDTPRISGKPHQD